MTTIIRPLRYVLLVLLGAGTVTGALAIFAACAHADPGGSAPAAVAADTATWLLGGLVALKLLEMVLTWVAPRTKATWDDDLRDAVHGVREATQEILTHVKAPTTTTTVNVTQPAAAPEPTVHTRETSPGTTSTIGMLTVLLLGALVTQPACTKSKPYVADSKTAVIECGKEYAPALVKAIAAWGAAALSAGKVDWSTVEKDAITLGKDVGSCAVGEFVAALKKQPEPAVRSLIEAPSVVAQGEAVLARVSGGAEVRLP